jgi:osmotically-inducible protein OsmY
MTPHTGLTRFDLRREPRSIVFKEDTMSDLKIRRDILDELEFDPSIDAAAIGVSVENGVATLSGHVKSCAEKMAAEAVTWRVKGVRAIADEIDVRWPEQKRHADDEIAARALDIITWDTALPDGAIDVKVQRGWVTLSGEVRWHFQRMAAENAVKKLGGVVGVTNILTIRQLVGASDIKERIEQALRRNAEIEADGIRVRVSDSKVVLEGDVHAWSERHAAEQAAWSVPGVAIVENHLHVG